MRDRHKVNTNTIHLFTKRDRAQSHHSKINLYTRGISQFRRVTTWWFPQPKTNFSHKIKIDLFGSKTLLKNLCINTRKNENFSSFKT